MPGVPGTKDQNLVAKYVVDACTVVTSHPATHDYRKSFTNFIGCSMFPKNITLPSVVALQDSCPLNGTYSNGVDQPKPIAGGTSVSEAIRSVGL